MKRTVTDRRTVCVRSLLPTALLGVALMLLSGCALDRGRLADTGTETPRPTAPVGAATLPHAQTPPAVRPAALTAIATTTSGLSVPAGSVQQGYFRSATLNSDLHYIIYLPPGYATSGLRYPVLYLLHGKNGRMSDWLHVKSDLDQLIAAGKIPPLIAVLPDAPYSKGASYYVDSDYAGSETVPAGQKVETAFTRDLVAHVDTTYRTLPTREGRAVGGYSMGGWGAMRYALAHPDLYRASIVLSPAVYIPAPPAESGMRALGAFGKGPVLFDEATYQAKNYLELLPRVVRPSGLPLAMFVAAGDDEHHYVRPEDIEHDMDLEAHHLYSRLVRTENVKAELRIMQGAHCWDVWRPAFIEGVQYISQFLQAPAQ